MSSERDRLPVPVELNLMEFPVFYPSADRRRRPTIVRLPVARGEIEISSAHGVPGPFDFDVLIALIAIWEERGRPKEPFDYTVDEILRLMGLSNWRRREVEAALKRLHSVSFIFEGFTPDGIPVIEGLDVRIVRLFKLYDEQRDRDVPKKKARTVNRIMLDGWLLENYAKRLYRYIDFRILRQLSTGIAKRLYLYLSRHLGDQQQFRIRFSTLAERIPLESYIHHRHKGKAFRSLLRALDELRAKGVVAYRYEPAGRDYIFIFEHVYEARLRLIREAMEPVLVDLGLTREEIDRALERAFLEKTAIVLFEIARQTPLRPTDFFREHISRSVALTPRARRDIERSIMARLLGLDIRTERERVRRMTVADLYALHRFLVAGDPLRVRAILET